jgi:hypothetical protein
MRVHLLTPNFIRRSGSAVAAGALAFALLGGSALAAPPIRDTFTSTSAGAANVVCDGWDCRATAVFAFVNSPDGPSEACLDITHYAMAGPTGFMLLDYERGCAPLSAGGLSIDTKGLASAALGPTDITVQAFACDPTACNPTGTPRTVRVSATYTGVGDVDTFRSNGKSTFGGCTMYFGGKGSSREATATLTVDGQSIAALGSIGTSTQKTKVVCH